MLKFTNTNGIEINSWKIDNKELVYQKDGSWGKQDPYLFPNIGIAAKSWKIQGKNLELKKHGIFVGNENQFVGNGNSFVYKHEENDRYPFNCEIRKDYIENQNSIEVVSTISNLDNKDMVYQLGHHLAVKIDNNSKIIFEDDTYNINKIDLSRGHVLEDVEVFKTNNTWPIDLNVFASKDSLVFANSQVSTLTLDCEDYKLIYEFDKKFTCITIWTNSSEDDENKFICIEPWTDICTTSIDDHCEKLSISNNVKYSYKITYEKK